MPGCCVPQCSNHSRNGWKVYGVPTNAKRRRLWLVQIKRDDWEPSRSSSVCSAHFEPSAFEERRADGWQKLKPNAIPTLFSFRRISSDPLPPLLSCESYKPDLRAVSMEPIQSSSHGDERALLEKTSCPLKANGDIWFACCSCTYFTRDQHGIVNHLVAHGDEQVKCQPPFTFPASKFKVHSNTQKHRSDKLFKCKLCPRIFTWKSSLIDHNRTHSCEKPYKCQLCSKAFAHRTTLINHKRTHRGDKPFKCKLCSKEFSYKCSLIYHIQTHTGVKPFKCELCSQEFTRSSSLKHHNRIHSGEKPYKCNLCPQAFVRNSEVRRHNVTHSGEKPYKCELCSKAFAYRGGLIHHKRTHTGEKPYKCKLCPQEFAYKRSLTYHKRAHTGVKPLK
ncbi:zinc finger protein OZF-like isoform X2 [Ixodes scapularis]|uniref:zinc finger protein OZF-like isoform X2 n=1 Tax=Ixodes scapularis TaxID=6945 RepID=UPI001A9F177C|nr:zinc finger protein OZF-like isoform X2 [Ixodes scapularis]